MADTFTSKMNLTKPEPGTPGWDSKWAANLDAIDAVLGALPVLLETQIYTSGQATIDFDTNFDSTYDHYFIEFSKVWPSVANAELLAIIHANGAWRNTSGDYSVKLNDEAGAIIVSNIAQAMITVAENLQTESLANGSGATRGRMDIYMYDAAVNAAVAIDAETKVASAGPYVKTDTLGAFYRGGAYSLDGIRFYASSGNIEGEFRLFGVPK